jgi:hypothetical protein
MNETAIVLTVSCGAPKPMRPTSMHGRGPMSGGDRPTPRCDRRTRLPETVRRTRTVLARWAAHD